jgi:hypothetical protein
VDFYHSFLRSRSVKFGGNNGGVTDRQRVKYGYN